MAGVSTTSRRLARRAVTRSTRSTQQSCPIRHLRPTDVESEWTVETLKAHYDQRFIDQDRAVQAALNAAEKAVTKAETASEKRFDGVNELAADVAEQAQTCI